MTFCTAINCIDGRAQVPVIDFLKKRFQVSFVDMITEPGVDAVLADGREREKIESIFWKCGISVEKHESVGIAIAGHFDCAGNPVGEEVHLSQIRRAVERVREKYPDMEVLGLWLDRDFSVRELD